MGQRWIAVALAFWLLAPSRAAACSPACGIAVLPAGTDALPARLPANGVFIAIRAGSLGLARTTLDVARTHDGHVEMLSLVPSADPIAIDAEAGDRLVVTFGGFCRVVGEPTPFTTVIDVTPTAPLPSALGVLEVEPSRVAPVAVFDNGGGCTSDLSSAVAPYDLVLDASATPWVDAIVAQPMLDGAPWVSPLDPRIASSFVFAHCAAPRASQFVSDTTTGEHHLRIDATIRGTTTMVSSNEETFELTCAGGAATCAVTPPSRSNGMSTAIVGIAMLVLHRARRRR